MEADLEGKPVPPVPPPRGDAGLGQHSDLLPKMYQSERLSGELNSNSFDAELGDGLCNLCGAG